MKRLVIGVAATVALLAGGVLPHADAASLPKLAKPPKVDVTKMLVVGGLFPTVKAIDPFVNNGQVVDPSNPGAGVPWGYGRVAVFIPAPAVSLKIHTVTLTCKTKPGAGAGAGYPTDDLTTIYQVQAGATRYSAKVGGATSDLFWSGKVPAPTDPTTDPNKALKDLYGVSEYWSLWTNQYPGEKAPQLACAVTLDNTNLTNWAGASTLLAGGAAVASKAPKTTTGPASNCPSINSSTWVDPITDEVHTSSVEPPPVAPTEVGKLNLRVRIEKDPVQFTFCTTDSDANPKWLTDQQVNFSSAVKVKTQDHTVTFKKVKLTAPLSSSLLLTTTGSQLVFSYPAGLTPVPVAPTTNTCSISAAKAPNPPTAKNTCVFDTTARTITMTSPDVGVVKPGKPIVGPVGEFTFTYDPTVFTTGEASLKLVSSATIIKFAGFVVAVSVDDTAGCDPAVDTTKTDAGNTQNACFPGQGATDPNYNWPVVTATGLI